MEKEDDMPWKETSMMSERMEFIKAALDRGGMGSKHPGDTVGPKVSGGWAAIYNSGLDLCDL
jgi:hypothetical protein